MKILKLLIGLAGVAISLCLLALLFLSFIFNHLAAAESQSMAERGLSYLVIEIIAGFALVALLIFSGRYFLQAIRS